jgi:F-type H+-transporting ATPase subunit delta
MMKDSRELSFLVRSPSINRASQLSAITALATRAGFDQLTKNFFGVLIQNRRLSSIGGLINVAIDELATRRGEMTVKVETAQDLTPAQLKSLQEILAEGMNRKISIQARVEPSILGGMIVTAGSHMIDDSVRRKLQRLKAAMARQANENMAKAS